MWSTLEKVPCGSQKNVYSFVFEWNILYVSVKPNWVITSVSSFVSLLSFCLVVQSSVESGVLKSPTISL